MHELAVTESILEIALRHGTGAGAARITDLYLVVGELSTIVDDSVQFYWDLIAQGTLAEGAQLHFRRIPAAFLCLDCGERYPLREDSFTCPGCGGARAQIEAGEEFAVEAIEIEESHDRPGSGATENALGSRARE
jgi:hydrogenase nickel incorporation protein HypA/HybF